MAPICPDLRSSKCRPRGSLYVGCNPRDARGTESSPFKFTRVGSAVILCVAAVVALSSLPPALVRSSPGFGVSPFPRWSLTLSLLEQASCRCGGCGNTMSLGGPTMCCADCTGLTSLNGVTSCPSGANVCTGAGKGRFVAGQCQWNGGVSLRITTSADSSQASSDASACAAACCTSSTPACVAWTFGTNFFGDTKCWMWNTPQPATAWEVQDGWTSGAYVGPPPATPAPEPATPATADDGCSTSCDYLANYGGNQCTIGSTTYCCPQGTRSTFTACTQTGGKPVATCVCQTPRPASPPPSQTVTPQVTVSSTRSDPASHGALIGAVAGGSVGVFLLLSVGIGLLVWRMYRRRSGEQSVELHQQSA